MTESWKCKVADFGLSRFTDKIQSAELQTLSKLRGTYCYIAPEVGDEMFSPQSDIYSFGITIWEVLNRTITGVYQQPFSEFKVGFDFQILMMSKEGKRPTLPKNCPKSLKGIYDACVNAVAAERPLADELCERFRSAMRKAYRPNRDEWDALIAQRPSK
jgi:serine/threonine protein kinase